MYSCSMKKIILHADMDAFFAAVEQVNNPSLKGKPVIIGADPVKGKGRGVVSTASYEARKFGVHSAMSVSEAYRKCPEGIFLFPNMELYKSYSKIIFDIFRKYTPLVEPLSIDEAFLDCTGSEKLYGDGVSIAKKIKEDVFNSTGLTVSVGVSSNKSVSKIASDLNKPDGLSICPYGKEKEFLSELHISCIWGVGKKTVKYLESIGIHKVGDLAVLSSDNALKILGNNGLKLRRLANGIDNREVIAETGIQKSLTREHTFYKDVSSYDIVMKTLFKICDTVCYNMRRDNLKSKTAVLKVRFENFETLTRNYTFDNYITTTNMLYSEIKRLFELVYEINDNRKIRLIGAGVTNIIVDDKIDNINQLDLFQDKGLKIEMDKCDMVYDNLKNKYGNKIKRASLI